MARTGRPKIEINWKEAEKLCSLQCTQKEIADWFHISVDTLDRRLRQEQHMTFADFFQKNRVAGLISLRRNMFQMSQRSAAMAIFLGKNWLGMKDSMEITGDEKKPIILIYEPVSKVPAAAS